MYDNYLYNLNPECKKTLQNSFFRIAICFATSSPHHHHLAFKVA